MFLVRNYLVHTSSGCHKFFQIFLCTHRVFYAAHVDIPLTYYVYVNRTVVENSAPEGLLHGYGEYARHNVGFLMLGENAASLNNLVVIEGNCVVLNIDDFHNHNDERNDEEGKQNVPRANYAPSASSHYVIGFYSVSHGKSSLLNLFHYTITSPLSQEYYEKIYKKI